MFRLYFACFLSLVAANLNYNPPRYSLYMKRSNDGFVWDKLHEKRAPGFHSSNFPFYLQHLYQQTPSD
ncbi:Oidioi.mRNA.OKI2018_I69.PAR.g8591.t1.cds [Oikopleura dioica]|uniref:Oidioi.mRNA.OKI2018_I69.PAR.g8591.t1.cds n=1 Tax=Oikopleura dioica TaxID=34765 RepID=A0ABN7RJ63_OIKDI|nr:Oidioi.mRNA.OKI2018_I69.PAR.g8591.t1.cds [Oikopleura dioica]